ncbi:MAG: hypothetical protein LBS21_08370 [Clostridiales bacterium]|jgi:hypothetical protein|nr:hypothetical protein [Clostridiales bacterium]
MKSIMELFKGDAIKFFGIDKKIVSVERTELTHKSVKKTDDWMLITEDDTYIHVEFQTTYSKEDLSRFMLSDAMLYHREGKPIRTIVVYSAEIKDTITTINAGALQYGVEAFYMVKMDGDKAFEEIKAKIEAGAGLTKQDLMSIVFLPMMKSKDDKVKRLERSIMLSKEIKTEPVQTQIQAMLEMLAEKFVDDEKELTRLKGMMKMGVIFDMIREDLREELRDEITNKVRNEITDEISSKVRNEITDEITNKSAVETAKIMIEDGAGISTIAKYTRLSESRIRELKADMAEAS